MASHISRRSIITTGVATLVVGPSVAQVDPWTWAWVAAALASGAMQYIGGAALARAIGAVTTDQLLSAIEKLRRDLPELILNQARIAVLEGELRTIQGYCRAVDLNLGNTTRLKIPIGLTKLIK
jgi:hypothetical protein